MSTHRNNDLKLKLALPVDTHPITFRRQVETRAEFYNVKVVIDSQATNERMLYVGLPVTIRGPRRAIRSFLQEFPLHQS